MMLLPQASASPTLRNERAGPAQARGLLGEGTPQGFDRWPSKAQAAYYASYEKGRHCRRVAEGKEHVATAEPTVPDYAATGEQLADLYQRRADLQREFLSEADFVAFALAERSGKLRISRRPAASAAA